jgi:outer membrane immunogenic protein
MRKFVPGVMVAFASMLALNATATAADMPVKAPAYSPACTPAPAFSWSGFYVGGNVGYG